MSAQFVMAGSQSSIFPVEVGVKQRCVLAPIIFYLLLVAITIVPHRDLQPLDSVGIESLLDGALFNLRRLLSNKRDFLCSVFALQYDDDAAFPSPTADGHQRRLGIICETYLRASHMIYLHIFTVRLSATDVLRSQLVDLGNRDRIPGKDGIIFLWPLDQ